MSQAMVKHRWQLLGLTVIVIAIITPIWYSAPSVRPVQAQSGEREAPTSLDVQTWSNVQQLRRELLLQGHDMAAMGMTQPQAEALLASLLQWEQANRQALQSARQAKLAARKQLREAMQQVHVGPSPRRLLENPEGANTVTPSDIEQTMSRLPALVQANQDAQSNVRAMLDQLMTTLEAELGSEVRSLWSLARENRGAPARYRYVPNLTNEQIEQLTRRGQGLEQESNVLSFTQQQAIEAASGRAVGHLPQVRAAERAVLPTPEEVKAEREAVAETAEIDAAS